MKNFLILLILSFTNIFPTKVWAQDASQPSGGINLPQLLEKVRDPLQQSLQEAQRQEEGQKSKNLPLITGPEEMVKTIKNPFISKLPRAEIKPVAVPTTVTTSAIQPAVATPPAIPKPSFKISGLVWNTPKPQAIINDRVYKVGDTIESWAIISIGKKGVEVISQNTKYLLEP